MESFSKLQQVQESPWVLEWTEVVRGPDGESAGGMKRKNFPTAEDALAFYHERLQVTSEKAMGHTFSVEVKADGVLYRIAEVIPVGSQIRLEREIKKTEEEIDRLRQDIAVLPAKSAELQARLATLVGYLNGLRGRS